MKQRIQLTVNGERSKFTVEPWQTLLDILRDEYKVVRTKEGCGVGECGSCAVAIDKKLVPSCLVLAVEADGKKVITMEGLTDAAGFQPIAEAFIHAEQGVLRATLATPGTKAKRTIFTFCHLCCGHCSVKVIVEDDRIVDMEPDMESGFSSEQCPLKKGRHAIPEVLYHRDRVIYPQKRVGARGEGKWQRISWDEALATIAEKFKRLKEDYGPTALAFGLGEPKGMEFAFAQRFASAYGTPNVVTPGWSCGVPLGQGSSFTYGWNCVPDDENIPALVVLWGCNLVHTTGGMRRETLTASLESGGKLIVIDPNRIDMARVADLWIKIRPGSDGALAMGALKIMIEEKLYDQDIAANWTVGLNRLTEHVKTFSLEEVEQVTWVPRQQIEEFARLYARVKPGVIQWGNALDQLGNSFQTGRAIGIMRGLTGNLNIPGGDVFLTPAEFTRPGRFFLLGKYPRKPERILGDKFKMAQRSGFIPPHTMMKAVLEEKPYPIKAAMFILTNPLVSYPNSQETYAALMKLEFTVVSELFMTPTAALADIVLPAAWGMEHEEVGYWPGWYEEIRAHPKIIDPPGECWPDTKILNELAKRMGMRDDFWENEHEALDYMLAPSGMTYEQFKEKRVIFPLREYRKHDYRTPSGKIEIYSAGLRNMGYEPMPVWSEVKSIPEATSEYPLLLTNAKEEAYMLSSYKSVASIRMMRPDPVVEMNPKMARKLKLKEGSWVTIETKEGKIQQRLSFNREIDPRVVMVAFGWWYPEEAAAEFGWRKSNINMLTSSGPDYDTPTGGIALRGIPCKVYTDSV